MRKKLRDIVGPAFAKIVDDFNEINKEVISTPRQWDEGFGVTRRRNGEVVVGSVRNIVDLGNLLDSQNVEIASDGLSAVITWTGNGETPVVLQYTGWSTANGRVPGRPWVEEAIIEYKNGSN